MVIYENKGYLCEVCGEKQISARVEGCYKKDTFDKKFDLYVCEECRDKVVIWNYVVHNGGFGTKFSELREKFEWVDYNWLKEFAENQKWAELKTEGKGNRIIPLEDHEDGEIKRAIE